MEVIKLTIIMVNYMARLVPIRIHLIMEIDFRSLQ